MAKKQAVSAKHGSDSTANPAADSKKRTPSTSQRSFTPRELAALGACLALCVGLGLAFTRVPPADRESGNPVQRADNDSLHARLVSLEQAARTALVNDRSPRMDGTDAAFRLVLKEGKKQDWPAMSAHVVGSARAYLGLVAYVRQDWGKCLSRFQPAMSTADSIAGIYQYLRENPLSLPISEVEATVRRMIDRYSRCLIQKEPDFGLAASPAPPHRQLYQRAAAAGVIRHEWQGAVTLSPVEWQLRAQPYWSVEEAGCGALAAALKSQDIGVLQAEAETALVRRLAKKGVKVTLNQEVLQAGRGQWMEMFLWTNGAREASCDAVPTLCAALEPHLALFHPKGHVKLSHLTGGTTAKPHSGPIDTKLRMHWTISLPPHRAAQITVGGEARTWRQGEALIFDDSFEHHVVFDAPGSANRMVLIVDLVHPDAVPHMGATAVGG